MDSLIQPKISHFRLQYKKENDYFKIHTRLHRSKTSSSEEKKTPEKNK